MIPLNLYIHIVNFINLYIKYEVNKFMNFINVDFGSVISYLKNQKVII